MSTEMENRIADGDLYLLIPGKLGGELYGKKRSMVFAYGEVSKQAIM